MAKRKRGQLDTFPRNNWEYDHDISESDEDNVIINKQPTTKRCTRITWKYDISYIRLGFSSICDGELPKPQCVVCGEVLSNEALKPSKLSRHSQTKHKDFISKPIKFFQRKRDEFKGSQRQMYVSSHKCFSTASSIQGSLS